MITGAIFSMADLNSTPSYLYAKYKVGKVIVECEINEEISEYNVPTGYTDVTTKEGKQETILTKKLFDYEHSEKRRF